MRSTLRVVLAGDGRLKLLGYQKVRYAVNWKAYNDNDGFHAPLLHTGFRLLNWQGGQGAQFMTPNGHISIEAQLKPIQSSGFLKDRFADRSSRARIRRRARAWSSCSR